MRLPGSSRIGSVPCLQSSTTHSQQTGFATVRQSPQSVAVPMLSIPASGCESSSAMPARGMQVQCSADGSSRASKSKSGKSSAPSPSFQTDLGQIRGVGPVNESLLISQGVSSVQALTNLYRGLANSNSQEMIKYLQVTCQRKADISWIRPDNCTAPPQDSFVHFAARSVALDRKSLTLTCRSSSQTAEGAQQDFYVLVYPCPVRLPALCFMQVL